MAVKLTKRERVIRTINFQETDRVPVYDIIHNDSMLEYYGGAKLTEQNAWELLYKTIRETLDMTRLVRIPYFNLGSIKLEGEYEGFSRSYQRWTSWIESPFKELQEIKEWIKKHIKFRNEWYPDGQYVETYRKYINDLQSGIGDDTVVVIESPVGLDRTYTYIGLEAFSYLMADDPDLVTEWLEALIVSEIRRAKAIADPELVPVMLTFSDIAYKGNLMFSPTFLKKEFFPRLKKLNDVYHEKDVKCLFHSDGYLMNIMDELISAEIDGINPIEIAAGMNLKEVKQKYGNKIFITGGIDVNRVLKNGDVQLVKTTCENAIRDAAYNGGYFLGSSTEIYYDIPLNNAVAMIDTAHSSGPVKGTTNY
ncbi:MAG: uroporphyrinogen decarboxylase family protein [Desulfitobacteriaceae bacterium]